MSPVEDPVVLTENTRLVISPTQIELSASLTVISGSRGVSTTKLKAVEEEAGDPPEGQRTEFIPAKASLLTSVEKSIKTGVVAAT